MKFPPETGHFFAQDEHEFSRLLWHMAGSGSMLEIGSRYGETLWRFAAHMPAGSRIVSVDLGDDPFTPQQRTSLWWYGVCGRLAEQHDVHLIEGNSHDAAIIKRVKALGTFDFGFIDGDHTTSGVREDWLQFSAWCRVLAFHDILLPAVAKVWKEAKKNRRHVEYTQSGKWGIGVLLP